MSQAKNTEKDALGTRMKDQYENRTRYCLPRRTYAIIRADVKAWHTYTRGLVKPFDADLITDLDASIVSTLPHIQGAVFAYTQSDEISILLTDFESIQTSAWFDNNIQKMTSVTASILTAEFNRCRFRTSTSKNKSPLWDMESIPPAYFDARVFTIPDRVEVMNYFLWRQLDCVRNSVSAVAQANFSHKELQGKSTTEMHEMLHVKGVNWATDFTDREKNGALVVKKPYQDTISVPDVANFKVIPRVVERTKWVAIGTYKFTEGKDCLLSLIPSYPE